MKKRNGNKENEEEESKSEEGIVEEGANAQAERNGTEASECTHLKFKDKTSNYSHEFVLSFLSSLLFSSVSTNRCVDLELVGMESERRLESVICKYI